jgi:hypothetical protein
VLFFYFDMQKYNLTASERSSRTLDQSRNGFSAMLDDDEWKEFSADNEHGPKLQYIKCSLLEAPVRLMKSWVPISEFSIDQ